MPAAQGGVLVVSQSGWFLSHGPQQELVTRHYTLTEGQRDRAVKLGAQVITAREADKMERQRAGARGESQP
jgi:hypothetical protein